MTALIVIDDGTNPPAIGSTDNPFSFLGAVHDFSNFDNTGILGHTWTLVDRPIGSSAALSALDGPTTTLTPDVPGSYLVQLETFTDAGKLIADGADRQVIGVRFDEPYPWLVPAAGETNQQSTTRGWAGSREEAIRDLHGAMSAAVRLPVSGTTTDATPTNIATFPMEDARIAFHRLIIIGVSDDGTERYMADKIQWSQRTGGGTVGSLGADTRQEIETTAGLNAGIGGDGGNNVVVNVIGLAATNIRWRGFIEYFEETET